MLKFIGSGSAFNTKLGNNSAYYKFGNEMMLIDCGSNIFQRIKENNLLEGINEIHVIITHTHADHVGSLGDLVLYTYYSHGDFAKKKLTVYSMENIEVDLFLKMNGCSDSIHYDYKSVKSTCENIEIEGMDLEFYFFEQSHVDEIECYGIEMNLNNINTWIHYSSDSNNIEQTADFIINYDKEEENCNVYYYIDTCKADYEGNVHLSLRELTEAIPQKYRHKVWCMHLDEGFTRQEAEELGFNVVNNEF